MKAFYFVLATFLAANGAAQLSYDLAVLEAAQFNYVTPGSYVCKPLIHKLGTQAISGLRVNWQINNGPIQSAFVTDFDVYTNWAATPMKDRVSIPMPINFPTTGSYELKVWCSDINGSFSDQNSSNDAHTKIIKVLPYVPPHHITLDYYSHTTCGPCGQSAAPKMAAIERAYPGIVDGIAIHHTSGISDPYTNAQTALLNNGMGVNSHPEFHYDRFLMPMFDMLDPFGYPAFMDTTGFARDRLEYTEAVEVKFSNVQFDPQSLNISAELKATFYDTIQANMGFTLYVAEDSIQGYQAGAVDPNNYWHRNVFRMSLGDPFGENGSAPNLVLPGQTISYTFNGTLSPDWNISQLKLYGALVNIDNTNLLNRRLYNSARVDLEEFLASVSIDEESPLEFTVWPTIGNGQVNIKMGKPLGPLYRLEVFNMSGKLLRLIPAQGGQQIFRADISSESNGIYMIRYIGKSGTQTQRIIKR